MELEKPSLSARSRKLFTLSALYQATVALLSEVEFDTDKQRDKTVSSFWHEVAKQLKEWQLVQQGTIVAGDVRADFIHSHGVVLHAIGHVGNTLLKKQLDFSKGLGKLSKIDWRRSNSKLWEGRAMIGGHISKGRQNVVLTTNAIKKALDFHRQCQERHL